MGAPASTLEEVVTGGSASTLEELAMGALVSGLDVLGSGLCGEFAVLDSVLFLAVKLSNSS